MSHPTKNSRDFANAIIGYETIDSKASDSKVPVGCLAIEKLRPRLSTLMGIAGFNALLDRAQALGRTDFTWLDAVPNQMESFCEELYKNGAEVEIEEFREGCAVLLSHLLGLLVTFIGQDLTLRLVHDVWPELSPDNMHGGKGIKNEKGN